MLAAKRRLRVAPVPPQAADLTRPARVVGTMPGRDEGTGASIEPRNNGEQASDLAVTIARRLQSFAQWWVRLNYASHTEIRILPNILTPHNCCVRFVAAVADGLTQHSLPSGRYPLLGPDFHRLDQISSS
jgi:hypothetical protein